MSLHNQINNIRPELDKATAEYNGHIRDVVQLAESEITRVNDVYGAKMTSMVPASSTSVNQVLRDIGLHTRCDDVYVDVTAVESQDVTACVHDWLEKKRAAVWYL